MAGITSSKIQSNIDLLYDISWMQPNAFFPTVFGYSSNGTDTGMQSLLIRMDDNGSGGPRIIGAGSSDKKSILDAEEDFSIEKADNTVLALIQNIDGLNFQNLPFQKKGGVLAADKNPDSSEKITIHFGLDKDFSALRFIKKWQQLWFTKDSSGFAFKTHINAGVGEGYLGLSNVLIKPDGSCETLSHISLFGLVPIDFSITGSFGPTTSASDIPQVNLQCLYSQGVLSFPQTAGAPTGTSWCYFLK